MPAGRQQQQLLDAEIDGGKVSWRPLSVIHLRQSQRPRMTAATIPANWAAMKAATPAGAIPAIVSDSERAMVTAGLANDVEAVNQ
jgi:hypothetical protein